MSDKPTELPRWADVGGDIDVPPSGKQDIGWVGNELPPNQFFNWLQNRAFQWLEWIDNGLWTRPSLTDNTPVVATTDRDGRVRHYSGPEGYWMGPAIQETHRWSPIDNAADHAAGDIVSTARAVLAVTFATDALARTLNGSVTAPRTGGPQLRLKVTTAATSNESVSVISESNGTGVLDGLDLQPIADIDNVVAVMEWTMHADTIGASGVSIVAGFSDMSNISAGNVSDGTSNSLCIIHREPGDTNWQATVGDNTAETQNNTGVAVVADQLYEMRIEYHGKNTPVGVGNSTAAVARFFIDGVEVEEITDANVPNGTGINMGFIVHAGAISSPGANVDAFFGPVKLAWNHLLNASPPA